MKLALVGHGKMGRVVEELAAARGVQVVARYTRERPLRESAAARRELAGVTALIDFSAPEAVAGTVEAAARLSLPLVLGTTGWQDRLDEIRERVEAGAAGVVWASNFSLGVNVFYQLAEQAARLLAPIDGYDPFINDWHHRAKQDRPSGTALELARRMALHYGARQVPISCQRAGYVPSVHAVGFDSEADTIFIEHRAHNRQGFAAGALLAADWIGGRRGFHHFQEALADLLPAAPAAPVSAAPAASAR
jgi:4-hydroxy-tetrahydrodipicolinate reductase